uniref:Uncharacterized protein n=1 Tax=Helianthus annuus TaxID=4232 RepID=A0A251SB22_HELAN
MSSCKLKHKLVIGITLLFSSFATFHCFYTSSPTTANTLSHSLLLYNQIHPPTHTLSIERNMRPWRTLPLLADVRLCKAAVDRGNDGAHRN